MTRFVGERVKHLHRNYVVRAVDISDPIVKRLLRDPRVAGTTAEYLKAIDSRYELLSEHDEPLDKTLKEIKYTLGVSFKLQTLRVEHKTLYDRLRKLGKPQDLLKENGFVVEVGSTRLSRNKIRSRLWSLVDDKHSRRIVGLERRSPSTYAVIKGLAKEKGVTVKEYVENELGFKYGKDK